MNIDFTNAAAKNFHKLPGGYQKAVQDRLAKLKRDYRSPELDIKPYKGKYPDSYRLRVGRIRVVYYISGETIMVYAVGFRGDVYKK